MTQNHPKSSEIIWQPNAGKQTFALTRTEREILYGGSRGGGKTDASIAWLTRWFNNPELKFLVIRRNSDDLRDWILRAKSMWRHLGAEFLMKEVRLPSGATGIFGHLHDEDSYERYQGAEYQKIVIEELTHIPSEELYLKLIGSCRSTSKGLFPQIFSTTNPTGIGRKWVKERFVDVIEPGTPFKDPSGNTRIFIPAKVEDNPKLIERDPQYVAYLESLPIELRKAWRDGSWEETEIKGAYYTKWVNEARREGRIGNVPHEKNLVVHTWWDLGVGDSTAIGFFQQVGKEWRMIDYYENSGEGLAFYIKVLQDKKYVYGSHYAPHDIEVRELSTGRTRREAAKQLGIDFRISPNVPIEDGIDAVRARFNTLWFDEKKCAPFIDAISQYRKEFDEKRNEYKAKPLHDWTSHASDMLRYWAVTDSQSQRVKAVRHGY